VNANDRIDDMGSTVGWIKKGDNALRSQKYEDAIKYYRKAIELSPKDDIANMRLANVYTKTNSIDKSIEIFETMTKNDPGNYLAYYNLGVAYRLKGNYDKEIEMYEKYISINTRNADVYCALGDAYCDKGNYDKAIELFENANKAIPDDANICSSAGRAYLYKSNYDKAIEMFKKAINIYPTYVEILNKTGHEYEKEQSSNTAVAMNSISRETNRRLAYTYYCIGDAYFAKENYVESMSSYEKTIEICNKIIIIDPKNQKALLLRGAAYAIENKYNRALDDITQALKINPKNSLAYNDRGIIYSMKGQNNLALKDKNKAIELESNRPNAGTFSSRGWTFLDMESYVSARNDFEKAVTIDPSQWESILGMAIVNYHQGKTEEAVKYYNHSAEIEPLLKKGSKGIMILEKRGQYFGIKQKNTIAKLIELSISH